MRATRILLVLLGLVLAGAVMGAIAGCIVAVTLGVALEGTSAFGQTYFYTFGAMIGAACGALLAPAASFIFLRHVPLWRVFVDTTVGTVIPAVIAALLPVDLLAIMAAGTVGFLAAAARLAWRTPRQRAAALPPPAE